MLCAAAPAPARALPTFEPPRTEPEHTVRRAFPEHGVLRIEDLPRVPLSFSHLAAQELTGTRHSTPRREIAGACPSGKKKEGAFAPSEIMRIAL